MIDNFKKCLELVLHHEGGWADDPHDPGGATMKGVTISTFKMHYGNDKTKEDLKSITAEQLEHIYKTGYWDKIKGDKLPSGLDYALFDFAVNSGSFRAVKYLQSCLGCKMDGIIGVNTLSAVLSDSPEVLIKKICSRRLDFLKTLKTWKYYGNGWSNRINNVLDYALKLSRNL